MGHGPRTPQWKKRIFDAIEQNPGCTANELTQHTYVGARQIPAKPLLPGGTCMKKETICELLVLVCGIAIIVIYTNSFNQLDDTGRHFLALIPLSILGLTAIFLKIYLTTNFGRKGDQL